MATSTDSSNFPPEIRFRIATFLDHHTILRGLCLVSKDWRDTCYDPLLWKHVVVTPCTKRELVALYEKFAVENIDMQAIAYSRYAEAFDSSFLSMTIPPPAPPPEIRAALQNAKQVFCYPYASSPSMEDWPVEVLYMYPQLIQGQTLCYLGGGSFTASLRRLHLSEAEPDVWKSVLASAPNLCYVSTNNFYSLEISLEEVRDRFAGLHVAGECGDKGCGDARCDCFELPPWSPPSWAADSPPERTGREIDRDMEVNEDAFRTPTRERLEVYVLTDDVSLDDCQLLGKYKRIQTLAVKGAPASDFREALAPALSSVETLIVLSDADDEIPEVDWVLETVTGSGRLRRIWSTNERATAVLANALPPCTLELLFAFYDEAEGCGDDALIKAASRGVRCLQTTLIEDTYDEDFVKAMNDNGWTPCLRFGCSMHNSREFATSDSEDELTPPQIKAAAKECKNLCVYRWEDAEPTQFGDDDSYIDPNADQY